MVKSVSISALQKGDAFYSGHGTGKHIFLGYENNYFYHFEDQTGDVFKETSNIKVIPYLNHDPRVQDLYKGTYCRIAKQYPDSMVLIGLNDTSLITFLKPAKYLRGIAAQGFENISFYRTLVDGEEIFTCEINRFEFHHEAMKKIISNGYKVAIKD